MTETVLMTMACLMSMPKRVRPGTSTIPPPIPLIAPMSPARMDTASVAGIFMVLRGTRKTRRRRRTRAGGSESFNRQGDRLPAGEADCGHATPRFVAGHGVEQGGQDAGAAAPHGVTERDRPAVDIDPVECDAKVTADAEDHRGERLVDLKQIHVFLLPTHFFEQACGGLRRGDGEPLWCHRRSGLAHDAGQGLPPAALSHLLRSHHHGGRAVAEAARIACGHGAAFLKGRSQRGEFVEIDSAWLFVFRDHLRLAFGVRNLDGDDLLGKLAAVHGAQCFRVTAAGEIVLFLARDPVLPGEEFRAVPHVQILIGVQQPIFQDDIDNLVVTQPVPGAGPRQQVGGGAHVLHPACHDDVSVACGDGLGRQHHRLQAGAAHLVDGGRRDGCRQSGIQRGLTPRRLPQSRAQHISNDDLVHLVFGDLCAAQRLSAAWGCAMAAGSPLPVRQSCHRASNSDTLSWRPAATPASSSTGMCTASWSCAVEVKPWWPRRSSPWNRSMSCTCLPARRTAGSTTATSHSASSAPSMPSGIRPGLSTTRHGSGSGRTIRQPRMSFDRASMSPAIAGAHGFRVNNAGQLEIGGGDALALARDFRTPLHVLDEERLRANCGEYRDTLAEAYGPNARAIFASKACCTIATCQIAHQEGLGIDVASGGELHTALRAGVPAHDLYFHGNNKTPDEVEYGLRAGVGRFVVDNEHEFDR